MLCSVEMIRLDKFTGSYEAIGKLKQSEILQPNKALPHNS